MIIRMLAMAGGLAGAAGLSQYPEFAQQYTQRLAGQVTALETVVADFDATAGRSGLSRDAALAQMTGTPFLDDRRTDMTRTIGRYESLGRSQRMLETATPLERLLLPHRMSDPETFAGTWSDFIPALPLSVPGAVAASAGYLGGWLAVGGLLWLIAWPFRRLFGRREDDAPEEDEHAEVTLRPLRSARPVSRDLPPEPPLHRAPRDEPPLRRRLGPAE
ncbi:DUF2937 family protein [Roseisalinus antarcticus]|uniref:DUF2937 domain-containing protein n=1 Tax=Roseisalinus antarcticus TaxID=254357 RepID=A0A1Y5SUS9_9RHOB|nr:DUF2937 family protein [Roseisalinus antarcticus]SLN47458.1 hypothetical protein ROA7023_01996 [Roseisalinus antarcticus]